MNYARGQGLNIGERVGMTLDFMDPAKTRKEKYNIGEAVPTALNYMDAAQTKETGKIQHRRSRWHGVRFHES